jgi:hypothetical protein
VYLNLSLKCTKTRRYREEPPKKWPYINEELAFWKTVTGVKVTEPRNLGVLPYKIKCKWKNWLRKEHRFWRGRELRTDRLLQERKITNSIDL